MIWLHNECVFLLNGHQVYHCLHMYHCWVLWWYPWLTDVLASWILAWVRPIWTLISGCIWMIISCGCGVEIWEHFVLYNNMTNTPGFNLEELLFFSSSFFFLRKDTFLFIANLVLVWKKKAMTQACRGENLFNVPSYLLIFFNIMWNASDALFTN